MVVFGLFAFVLLGAIGATVLLANDYRNLNLLLARFGYDPVDVTPRRRELRPYEMKGNRLPRPKGFISERLITPVTPSQARFVRTIRKAPEALCEALRQGGFDNSGWKTGLFDKGSWECQSYREFPDPHDGESGPSSVFLSIRGDAQTRVSSFRIKLNIENPATQARVTAAVIQAIEIFLDEVRWQESPDIFAGIRALKAFDIVRFGNRIQLKKEFGETPRFNFIITPDRTQNRNSYLPDYFDRARWLPLPEKL
ncbi:DUF6030 family protein [Shinella sp. BYT-45]|uniref:DUF6030 family protein n=1 Tax=Shinella sp. BYT-45 TaxID=3377377 RepID=UPI00397FD54C